MDASEVFAVLSSTGFSVAYEDFDDPSHYPQISYYQSESKYGYADNSNGKRVVRYTAELYTSRKDRDAESAIENALRAAGITWYKEGDQRNKELGWLRVDYEFDVIE